MTEPSSASSGGSARPRLPDFLIVGAMKSGSSSLVELLNRHPEVSLPSRELYFFSERFEKGVVWYGEELRRRTVPARLIGEKCVTYGYIPAAASHIAGTLPGVKLVWILRNPVQRTYANYMHNRRNGVETLPFRAALEREAAGRARNLYTQYVARSCYVREIRRFRELFPLAQMHVLLFEELLARPMEVLSELFDFLGIAADGYEYRPVHRNSGGSPRFPFAVRISSVLFGFGGTVHRRVRELCTAKGSYPRMGAEEEAYLRDVLREPTAELALLLDRDLTAWAAGAQAEGVRVAT